jgi:hypothetical protein
VLPPQTNANPATGGLIVAAPGSTVVVQQVQPSANPSAKTATNKPNSFSQSKADSSTITTLVQYATNKDKDQKPTKPYAVLARAGAIDSLGLIGGEDQVTIDAIVKGLVAVLEMEFITKGEYTDTSGTSEFLCFHAVQAIGNLGWGGRAAIPQIQLLKGQNVILDGAIDHAISAMQTAPPPKAPATQGSDTSSANQGK